MSSGSGIRRRPSKGKGSGDKKHVTAKDLGATKMPDGFGYSGRSFPLLRPLKEAREQVLGGGVEAGAVRDGGARVDGRPDGYVGSRGGRFQDRLADAKRASLGAFDSLSGAMFGEGEDVHDSLDFLAVHILEVLREGLIEFAQLGQFEQRVFFRYVARTNPIIGRVVDLHTDLPLSKVRLQAPRGVPEIVSDYVVDFYRKVFERIRFDEVLREAVTEYNIQGFVDLQVDDYFQDVDKVIQSVEDLSGGSWSLSEENESFVVDVEGRYSDDPDSVSLDERRRYLEVKFPVGFVGGYRGPDGVSVLPFWRVLNRYFNEDVGYEAVDVSYTEAYKDLRVAGASDVDLVDLGYSKGFLGITDTEGVGEGSYTLENDAEVGYSWLLSLSRPDGTSPLHRVWREALEWDATKTAIRAKIGQIGQVGRVITAPEASRSQIEELIGQVDRMIEDPDYAIVTNLEVNWEETSTTIKDELSEAADRIPDLTEEIATGMGFPDSLISGDSSPYSGEVLQLEVLNLHYQTFAMYILDMIESRLIKPIAMRKGLVLLDGWGDPKLIYPTIGFTRIGIRSEDHYERVFELFEKGFLPLSIITDHLNLDIDDVRRNMEMNAFTLLDPNMSEVLQDIMGSVGQDIVDSTNVSDLIIESLPVQRKEKSGDEGGDGGGRGGRGRW